MRRTPWPHRLRLDEAVLRAVGRLGHPTAGEIIRRVPDVLGDRVCDRTVFRSIRRLVETGMLVANEAPKWSRLREYELGAALRRRATVRA